MEKDKQIKIYTEGEIKTFPEKIPLGVTIKKEDGEIIEVKNYRHRVNWKEGGRSLTSYCNNCGSALLLSGTVNVQTEKEVEKRKCFMCPACECFQGWENAYGQTNYKPDSKNPGKE